MIEKYLRHNEYLLNKNDFFNELNENELNRETLICFEKINSYKIVKTFAAARSYGRVLLSKGGGSF
jgi:hypothetical protein